MAIVNSRPLTVENLNDRENLEPITPNHLLTTKPVVTLPPPGKFIKEDMMYTRRRWRHVQYLADQFWSRWRKEYLSSIATRQTDTYKMEQHFVCLAVLNVICQARYGKIANYV